jgi:hypothetical protein
LVEGVTGGGDGAVDGALWGYVGVIGGLRVRGSCCRYHGRWSWTIRGAAGLAVSKPRRCKESMVERQREIGELSCGYD